MTPQQIFYKVATHLLAQGKPSYSGSGYCMYRHPDGLMCAVGCLIPDDLYKASIEGVTALGLTNSTKMQRLGYSLDEIARLEAAGISSDNADLLDDLQSLHDGLCPAEWREKLASIAAHYNFSTEVLACLN